MGTGLHINRTNELNQIRAALKRARSSAGQFIAVEAPEPMGKSALMLTLMAEQPSDMHVVHVDLGYVGGTVSMTPTQIVADIASQLDVDEVDLSRYTRCRDAQLGPGVVFNNVQMKNSSVNARDDALRRELLAANTLLEALTNDLKVTAPATLVFIDAFEKAGEWSSGWLVQQVVPRLLSVPHLVLVIAGKDLAIPLRRHFRASVVQLKGFDQTHIVDWLKAMSAPYVSESLEDVAHVICILSQGIPGWIQTFLLGLRQSGWRGQ